MAKPKRTRLPRKARRWAVVTALKTCHWDAAAAAKSTGERLRNVKDWKKLYLETKDVSDRKRSGRPKLLSPAAVAAACDLVEEQQSAVKATASLKQQGLISSHVSSRTVARAVRNELELASPTVRPVLTAQHKQRRVAFCQQQHDSNCIIAVDSTYLTLFAHHTRRKRWVRKGTKPVVSKPLKSQQLHVYAGITAHGQTELIRVTGTTGHPKKYYYTGKQGKRGVAMTGVGAEEWQEVLQSQLQPQAKQIFEAHGVHQYSWLLDGARAHTAASSKQFYTARGIQVLQDWPANSPDLSPIENAWAWLKREVYSRHHDNLDSLWEDAQATWASMPDSMLKNLMNSIATRQQLCVQRDGDHTGY